MERHPEQSRQALFHRIAEVIEAARHHVAQTANLAMVQCYYEIGRMIVEDEQGGRHRAGYGEKTLKMLSDKLTERFGKGFSTDNLERMRQFYLLYSISETSQPAKSATVSRKSIPEAKSATVLRKSESAPVADRTFALSWSHYIQLLRDTLRDACESS